MLTAILTVWLAASVPPAPPPPSLSVLPGETPRDVSPDPFPAKPPEAK